MYYRDFTDSIKSALPQRSYLTASTGNRNIIITTPHGGGVKPYNIKTRTTGQRLRDTYTRRLSEKIVGLFIEKPYYVSADIHRSKVDLNRSLEEATDGDRRAQIVWYDWNDTINSYKSDIVNVFGTGLLADIHSHNNNDAFHLGYNISATDYLRLKNNHKLYTPSTLDSFTRWNSIYDMVFGEDSISNSIELSGYKVYTPRPGETFFNGGYNIENFSDFHTGAIQIECPVSLLKYDLDSIAHTLYKSIELFSRKFT